ncbi:MAG TPA: ABC transporter permease subunit [Phycisphaerales bacterium]|nr:ABC transporter permease subunit [Phycisphaerales bacterium]
MTPLFAIARREFASFFRSSTGWVIIALYLLLSGFYVAFVTLKPNDPASMRAFFSVSRWLLLVVAPAISMKLLADEFRAGTIEPLAAAPVSEWAVVFGKYLGAFAFLLAMLAPTLLYVALLEHLANPDYGPILCGYLALLLTGALYLAVGTLASSLTQNQVVALLLTLFFFIGMEVIATQVAVMLGPPWDRPLFSLSLSRRVEDFARGVVDTSHLVFFTVLSAWFLILAVVRLESRRWR